MERQKVCNFFEALQRLNRGDSGPENQLQAGEVLTIISNACFELLSAEEQHKVVLRFRTENQITDLRLQTEKIKKQIEEMMKQQTPLKIDTGIIQRMEQEAQNAVAALNAFNPELNSLQRQADAERVRLQAQEDQLLSQLADEDTRLEKLAGQESELQEIQRKVDEAAHQAELLTAEGNALKAKTFNDIEKQIEAVKVEGAAQRAQTEEQIAARHKSLQEIRNQTVTLQQEAEEMTEKTRGVKHALKMLRVNVEFDKARLSREFTKIMRDKPEILNQRLAQQQQKEVSTAILERRIEAAVQETQYLFKREQELEEIIATKRSANEAIEEEMEQLRYKLRCKKRELHEKTQSSALTEQDLDEQIAAIRQTLKDQQRELNDLKQLSNASGLSLKLDRAKMPLVFFEKTGQ